VILFKEADSGETSPPPPNPPLSELPTIPTAFTGCGNSTADACNLLGFMGQIARYVRVVYPHVQQMFMHSRIYAGYANPSESPLNPEPYAYEQGLAIKWLIQAQIDEMNSPIPPMNPVPGLRYPDVAPWIDWGTYMWASGKAVPCAGCPGLGLPQVAKALTWNDDFPNHGGTKIMCDPLVPTEECDYQAWWGPGNQQRKDNTHPSLCGRDKVSNLMMDFYCNSPYTIPWFTAPPHTSACTFPHFPLDDSCTFPQGSDTQ